MNLNVFYKIKEQANKDGVISKLNAESVLHLELHNLRGVYVRCYITLIENKKLS